MLIELYASVSLLCLLRVKCRGSVLCNNMGRDAVSGAWCESCKQLQKLFAGLQSTSRVTGQHPACHAILRVSFVHCVLHGLCMATAQFQHGLPSLLTSAVCNRDCCWSATSAGSA